MYFTVLSETYITYPPKHRFHINVKYYCITFKNLWQHLDNGKYFRFLVVSVNVNLRYSYAGLLLASAYRCDCELSIRFN